MLTKLTKSTKKIGRPRSRVRSQGGAGNGGDVEGVTVRVYKHGGSLGVLIPHDFAHILGLLPDMRFRLTPCGDELVLSPADKPSNVAKALLTLFAKRTE